MDLTNLYTTIKAIVKETMISGEQPIVPHLKGPPGCGKTQIVLQVAAELGIPCHVLNLTAKEPVDLTGCPEIQEIVEGGITYRVTAWRPPKALPRTGPGIIFYDEIDACDMAIQKAITGLICEKALDEYRVPNNVCQIMAGNRKEDKAGITAKMPTHLCNRRTRIDVKVDLDSWRTWAATHNVDPRVIAFSRIRPDSMYVFDPKSDEDAFATLRSIKAASNILSLVTKHQLGHGNQTELLMGTIGSGVTAELDKVLISIKLMPDPDQLLNNPSTVELPKDNIDILFAIVEFMAHHALKMRDAKHIDAALAIAHRLPEEHGMILVTSLFKQLEKQLIASPLYVEWALKMAKLSV